LGPKT
jgi:hypothetical protein